MSEVNWHGTLRTVHFGLPHLLDRAHGHVVVVSSGAALRSFPWAAVYGGTKAAQRMFAEALRHELSGTGVSLTTVYPGEIATHLHDHEKDRMPDWYRGGPSAASPETLADEGPRGGRGRQPRRLVPADRRACSACCTTSISPALRDALAARALRGRRTRGAAASDVGRQPPLARRLRELRGRAAQTLLDELDHHARGGRQRRVAAGDERERDHDRVGERHPADPLRHAAAAGDRAGRARGSCRRRPRRRGRAPSRPSRRRRPGRASRRRAGRARRCWRRVGSCRR